MALFLRAKDRLTSSFPCFRCLTSLEPSSCQPCRYAVCTHSSRIHKCRHRWTMFNTKLPKLTAHTEAAAEYIPPASLHMATAWPLQSQSLVSAFQLPEPAVEKSSWLVTYLFLICWPCWAITAQVHLFQFDSVKSTLSLCKPSPTRNYQGGCAHRMQGWIGESQKNLFLCENIRASLRLCINSEILQIYRQ